MQTVLQEKVSLLNQVLFSDPFKYHISKHINPIDLYNIKYLNKYLYRFIDKDILDRCIISTINRRLYMIFKDKLFKLKNILKDTKSVISGSFILQCILNEHWDSDIDIYIPCQNIYYPDKNFDNIEYQEYTKLKYFFMSGHTYRPDRKSSVMGDHDDLSEDNILYNVRKYISEDNKYKIDLIGIKIKENILSPLSKIESFINTKFDIDVCKNLYYIDSIDKIKINDINSIFTKKTQSSHCYSYKNMCERYNKYSKRNFNIDINIDYMKLCEKDNTLVFKTNKLNDNNYILDPNIDKKIIQEIKDYSNDIKIIDNIIIKISKDNCINECHNECPILFSNSNIKHYHIIKSNKSISPYKDTILIQNDE